MSFRLSHSSQADNVLRMHTDIDYSAARTLRDFIGELAARKVLSLLITLSEVIESQKLAR